MTKTARDSLEKIVEEMREVIPGRSPIAMSVGAWAARIEALIPSKAEREFMEACCELSLNANDTFGYACADSEEIEVDELDLLVPLWKECGWHGVVAYMAVKRGEMPLTELQTDKFHTAYRALLAERGK